MLAANISVNPYFYLGIVAVFFLILIGVGSVSVFNEFLRELRGLNKKIRQAHGAERRHLLRRRRRLWLSLLPFIKY